MSETPQASVTPEMITETTLTGAIQAVLGQRTFEAISENSGFTAAHDRACMVAFMENRQGPEIEVLRVARRYISQKGRYPYYEPGPAKREA